MKLKQKLIRAAKARKAKRRHDRRVEKARLVRLKRWGLIR